MISPRKMTAQEFSIPVGGECFCGSQAEADSFSATLPAESKYTRLMLLISEDNTKHFCWCGFNEKDQITVSYSLFSDDPMPQTPPPQGRPLQEGEYLKYDNKFYIICLDKELGLKVKRISIFASSQEAEAVWRMSTQHLNTKKKKPECYLIKLEEVVRPDVPVCICWYIDASDEPIRFLPIFIEDIPTFNALSPANMNWEYLHEGETFMHNNKVYQVCKDEKNDYYIAPSLLQIYKQNM